MKEIIMIVASAFLLNVCQQKSAITSDSPNLGERKQSQIVSDVSSNNKCFIEKDLGTIKNLLEKFKESDKASLDFLTSSKSNPKFKDQKVVENLKHFLNKSNCELTFSQLSEKSLEVSCQINCSEVITDEGVSYFSEQSVILYFIKDNGKIILKDSQWVG